MKKILSIIPITLFALLLLTGLGNQKCWADIVDPLDGSGLSILLIDGTLDNNNTTVTFNILNFGVSGDLDYQINGGGWDDVPWSDNTAQLQYYGGDTLDFRLYIDSTYYYSYSSADATLTYSGYIAPSYAENPSWWDDPFYGTAVVNWTDLGESFRLEILTTPDVHDGFAPVPIPKSLLLLGAGLLGLIGFGFRRRKAHIT